MTFRADSYGSSFYFHCKTPHQLLDGSAQKFPQAFGGSQGMNPNDFGDLLTFPQAQIG